MKKSVRKRPKPTARKLVMGHLEDVSSEVFGKYPNEIKKLIKEHHGVYALYKKTKLYYVGLASSLGNRLKQHLKDKHAAKWDRFSLYLIRNSDHIKEIESLLLRIANPDGNTVKGGLRGATNLQKELKRTIQLSHKTSLSKLLGTKTSEQTAKKSTRVRVTRSNEEPLLAGLISKRFTIQRVYKGITYRALVRKDGIIVFAKKRYMSPSMAGQAIANRAINGWHFWKYKNQDGEWVKLNELRKS
jgi:Restriction Enzyme Adenine Methylase Associated/GIY-YIG catalytic domain